MTPQEAYDSRLPPEDPPEDIDAEIERLEDLDEDPEIPSLLRRRVQRQLMELRYG